MQFILLSVIPLALASRDAYTEKIFQMHNEFRKQILECKVDGQPAAKRMPPLVWDEELASQAKTLSRTCRIGYDSPKSSKLYPVAQYIAAYATVEQAMQSWFGQHKWYNFKNNQCSNRCRNYLQIVSANTTDIGCAVTKCPYSDDFKYGLFIVCNYGPGANLAVRPYEAKNINEVCPVKETAADVQPIHGQWQPTLGTMKFNSRNCYCFK
ncbi:unnamed protein product [Trichobilharzia szidati]|nr:unnamed protein product [Trichobilharzia szidati]